MVARFATLILQRSDPRNRAFLATDKYECRKARVYPLECSNNLGEIPQHMGTAEIPCFEEFFFFFWGGNTLGRVPAGLPHSLGYACTLYTPSSPPLTCKALGSQGRFRRNVQKLSFNLHFCRNLKSYQLSKQGKRPTKYRLSGMIRTP